MTKPNLPHKAYKHIQYILCSLSHHQFGFEFSVWLSVCLRFCTRHFYQSVYTRMTVLTLRAFARISLTFIINNDDKITIYLSNNNNTEVLTFEMKDKIEWTIFLSVIVRWAASIFHHHRSVSLCFFQRLRREGTSRYISSQLSKIICTWQSVSQSFSQLVDQSVSR